MNSHQIAVFMEERKWDYRGKLKIGLLCWQLLHSLANVTAFGFTAALLEGLPIIGLVFMISNRIGAAMWAHGMYYNLSRLCNEHQPHLDLEKRQHYITRERQKRKE